MSDVIWIEDQDQFQDLLDTEREVVVDFTAPAWCQPCQRFAPVFDAMSERSDVTFVAVDVDKADWAMVDYGIQSVPSVKFFKNGQFVTDLARTPQERTPLAFGKQLESAR